MARLLPAGTSLLAFAASSALAQAPPTVSPAEISQTPGEQRVLGRGRALLPALVAPGQVTGQGPAERRF